MVSPPHVRAAWWVDCSFAHCTDSASADTAAHTADPESARPPTSHQPSPSVEMVVPSRHGRADTSICGGFRVDVMRRHHRGTDRDALEESKDAKSSEQPQNLSQQRCVIDSRNMRLSPSFSCETTLARAADILENSKDDGQLRACEAVATHRDARKFVKEDRDERDEDDDGVEPIPVTQHAPSAGLRTDCRSQARHARSHVSNKNRTAQLASAAHTMPGADIAQRTAQTAQTQSRRRAEQQGRGDEAEGVSKGGGEGSPGVAKELVDEGGGHVDGKLDREEHRERQVDVRNRLPRPKRDQSENASWLLQA